MEKIFNDSYFIGQIFNDYINIDSEDFIQKYTRISSKIKNEVTPDGIPALQFIFKKSIFGATEFLTVLRVNFDVCLAYTNAKKTFDFADFHNSVEFHEKFVEVTKGDDAYEEGENKYRYVGEGLPFYATMFIEFTRPGGYAYEASITLKDWSLSM